MRFVILLAAFAALPLSVSAQRDTTRARDTTRVRDTSAVRLPTLDVTATATRSTRRPLEQPLAITELRASDLFGNKGAGLNEALAFVPGVIAQSRAGWSDVRLVIRGFGARGAGDRSNSGTSRGVRVLVDGFPETEPDGRTAFDLVDMANVSGIEVIRSSASAVWGNAAGGVVSLSTLRRATAPYAWLEPSFGSFGFRRVSLQAGYLPSGGELGASVTWGQSDGWRRRSDGERLVANVALTAPLGEEARVGVFATGGFNRYNIPGPLTPDEIEQDPEQANATYFARRERRFNRLGRLGITYETHLGTRHEIRSSLYAAPKFLQRSERGTFRDFTRYHVGGSMLYRYRSVFGESVASVLSVGVDEAYQDGAVLFYQLSADGERGDSLVSDKREGANNFGVFVQEELNFGSQWGLSLGARFDVIKYYAADHLDPELTGDRSFSRVSPKVGLNFRRSPTHSIYLSVGGGVEAPAGNETDPASTFGQDSVFAINPLLEPITSTSYEIGTKQVAVLGDGPVLWELTYDLAAYYTDVRNEIVPYRGGRFYFTAGRAGRGGVELGGRIRRGPVALQGAFNLSHHRYREYVVDSVHYGVPGATADFSDHKVVGVPDLTWSTGLSVTPVTPLIASVTVQGNSSYFADDANTVDVEGFTTVGLTLGLSQPVSLGRSGLGIRGFVSLNNLFDTRYIASSFLNPDVVNDQPVAFEPGLPRNFVVSLSLGWLQ
jgi:iron complex outermembrane receptor protein